MSGEFEKYRRGQARAWLEHVRGLRRKAEALRDAAEEQRAALAGLRGIDYSSPARREPSPDGIPNAVAAVEKSVDAYLAALAEFTDEQREARMALSRLPRAEHFELLSLRYCDGLEWEGVCERMGYTYDGLMKMHRSALCAAYGVMPARCRDPRHPAL